MGKNSNSNGRGFIGEPTRTLCSELRGDDTVIPDEAWAVHGEEVGEMDTGIPRPVSKNNFSSWIGYAADEIDRQNGGSYDQTEDEREARRRSSQVAVEARLNLIRTLGLSFKGTMCHIVDIYLFNRMDGVIDHYLNCKHDNDVIEAALEFAGKMSKYFPEISKNARKRLIAAAQIEQQLEKRIDGPAYRLGRAIFNSNWERLLRATV